jgi:glutaminase
VRASSQCRQLKATGEGDRAVVVAIATRDNPLRTAGDVDYRIAIESVSKPSMYA